MAEAALNLYESLLEGQEGYCNHTKILQLFLDDSVRYSEFYNQIRDSGYQGNDDVLED